MLKIEIAWPRDDREKLYNVWNYYTSEDTGQKKAHLMVEYPKTSGTTVAQLNYSKPTYSKETAHDEEEHLCFKSA